MQYVAAQFMAVHSVAVYFVTMVFSAFYLLILVVGREQ